MTARLHDLHQLTGAYAVNALTGAERAGFEKHLERCASCADEVRGLRETVARLGTATAIEPPAQMREHVLAAAARTRQLPPVTRARLAGRVPRFTPRVNLSRPVAIAGAALAAAAITVLAVFQAGTAHQLQQARSRESAIAAVLAAPGATIEASGTRVGGRVTVVISPRDHRAVVTAAGMPAPPGTRVYQLWVISAAGARSAGLLPLSGTGATSPVLADGVQPGDHLGITVEPAGGTGKPTTTPIVLVTARS